MLTNGIRKRTAVGSSQSDALPPVLVRLPALTAQENIRKGTSSAPPVADGDKATEPQSDPIPSEVEQERGRPRASLSGSSWWTVDHPVWQHWGTKAGLVVGACLLILVLYQVVGTKGGDDSSDAQGGKVAKETETAKDQAAPQREGPPAARRALNPKHPPAPDRGVVAVGTAKGPAKTPANRAQPGKLPAGKNLAGTPKPGVAARSEDTAQQTAAAQEPPAPPRRPFEEDGQELAVAPNRGQDNFSAGPSPPPPAAEGTPKGPFPDLPDLTGPSLAGDRGEQPGRDRSSSFVAGDFEGPAGPPAAGTQATQDNTFHTVSHAPALDRPNADWPRQQPYGGNDPAIAGGGRYPTTGTPDESYAWPPRESGPVARSEYGPGVEPARSSSFGEAPASMQPQYPTTNHPDDDYLRRRAAAEPPAYRMSARNSAGVPAYDGQYNATQPGTARLQGTIESSPIRSSYEQR